MLSILIKWLQVPGHKRTLVDILLNVFNKEHKESLKSLNAPEAGVQALSSQEWIWVKERCVRAGVPLCARSCFEAGDWLYHPEFSGYYLSFNHIGYFGIGFYFFFLYGKHFKGNKHYYKLINMRVLSWNKKDFYWTVLNCIWKINEKFMQFKMFTNCSAIYCLWMSK